jgi:hypothetical protein
MVQHLPGHVVCHVLDSAGLVAMAVDMQHGDTPCEHATVLSLDGGMKVSEGSTEALCVDGDVREVNDNSLVLFGQILHLEFQRLTMSHFLFAQMHPLCCTVRGQLLVCHAYIHIITVNGHIL